MSNRVKGVLKTYDPIKGYGFISRETGKDVFIFYSALSNTNGDATLVAGMALEFDIEETGKGPKANNVIIIG